MKIKDKINGQLMKLKELLKFLTNSKHKALIFRSIFIN